MEFGSRHDGYVRPSDSDSFKGEFKSKEAIAFGDIVHAPPNLKNLLQELDKQKQRKETKNQTPNLSRELLGMGNNSGSEGEANQEDEVEESDHEEEELSKKKKRKKDKVDWDRFNADESSGMGGGMGGFSSMIGRKNTQNSSSSQAELDRVRLQVQASYQKIKEKRRKLHEK
jgi:hypothetical protein